MKISFRGFILVKEKKNVIAETPVWVILHSGYLYEHPKLFGVLHKFFKEYKDDRNIIG